MISSLLIANRGEIAVRIIRACRQLGIRPVTVHSEADAGALHVSLSDASVAIGPAPAGESYLNIPRIIEAARETGAEAIHPGYGMQSENADFARAVTKAGLIFVGPSAEAIARMGDKTAARRLAAEAGLPVLPGTDGPLRKTDDAAALAADIGYPLLVKASFGGGGRGMRVVRDAADLEDAITAAQAEAGAAFGRAEVFLERYVDRPRHVEVQVVADGQGSVVTLGDRDCTVQRRHQKLLEEAPAPDLPDALRARLASASRDLALSIGYSGAATVEFLYDRASDRAFFLEVNTRLQVEHGVTEMVTGRDLVALQIRVASGMPLGFSQQDVVLSGHAIQARIAAEDPREGFRPSPGNVGSLHLPGGPGIRCDFGVRSGGEVPGHYDSMFGKIHAWGEDRAVATARLRAALDDFSVSGIATTAPYLRTVLDREDHARMVHDTGSVERDWPADDMPEASVGAPASPAAGPAEIWVSCETSEGVIEIAVPLIATNGHLAAPIRESRVSAGADTRGGAGRERTTAPMDCVVTAVSVGVGDTVEAGQSLVMLEAMKMQMPVKAALPGVVAELAVHAGQAVKGGDLLVRIAPAATGESGAA